MTTARFCAQKPVLLPPWPACTLTATIHRLYTVTTSNTPKTTRAKCLSFNPTPQNTRPHPPYTPTPSHTPVCLVEVLQQLPALCQHCLQAALSAVVLLVALQVAADLLNARREARNLNLCAANVLLVLREASNL